MLLLWIFLAVVLAMALAFVAALRMAVRWGREWQELKDSGRETTGTVTEKRQTQRRGAISTHIRYEYEDMLGVRHRSRRTLVTPDVWATHTEGGAIQVIYSQKHPAISLPKYLFDLGSDKKSRA